jgi:hypothetical protein
VLGCIACLVIGVMIYQNQQENSRKRFYWVGMLDYSRHACDVLDFQVLLPRTLKNMFGCVTVTVCQCAISAIAFTIDWLTSEYI